MYIPAQCNQMNGGHALVSLAESDEGGLHIISRILCSKCGRTLEQVQAETSGGLPRDKPETEAVEEERT